MTMMDEFFKRTFLDGCSEIKNKNSFNNTGIITEIIKFFNGTEK